MAYKNQSDTSVSPILELMLGDKDEPPIYRHFLPLICRTCWKVCCWILLLCFWWQHERLTWIRLIDGILFLWVYAIVWQKLFSMHAYKVSDCEPCFWVNFTLTILSVLLSGTISTLFLKAQKLSGMIVGITQTTNSMFLESVRSCLHHQTPNL